VSADDRRLDLGLVREVACFAAIVPRSHIISVTAGIDLIIVLPHLDGQDPIVPFDVMVSIIRRRQTIRVL